MRKDEVLDFLNKATKEILGNNSKETLDASYISNQLHCDRSNVSRIINELWREGKIIKIAGRPVSFLSYDSCLKMSMNLKKARSFSSSITKTIGRKPTKLIILF